jgi:hypothetical protein
MLTFWSIKSMASIFSYVKAAAKAGAEHADNRGAAISCADCLPQEMAVPPGRPQLVEADNKPTRVQPTGGAGRDVSTFS